MFPDSRGISWSCAQGNLKIVGDKLTHSIDLNRGAISNISRLTCRDCVESMSSSVPKLSSVSMGKRPRIFAKEAKARYGR